MNDRRRVRTLLLVLLVAVLSLMAGSCRPKQVPTRLENALRPGNKEYDDYVGKGQLQAVVDHKLRSETALKTTQLSLTGTIANSGNRTVTGIELHGYTVDMEGKPMVDSKGKPINQQVYVWMPTQNRPGPMRAGTSLPFQLIVTTLPTKVVDDQIGDVRIEISGVTFAK
ncbi:MAG TPA: hypothetical protein VFC63_04320 [Blastocatellia bacterium]|nr:hypothetical protein [Blastocatellia bacterium]